MTKKRAAYSFRDSWGIGVLGIGCLIAGVSLVSGGASGGNAILVGLLLIALGETAGLLGAIRDRLDKLVPDEAPDVSAETQEAPTKPIGSTKSSAAWKAAR